jgi:hypothetical protein
MFKLIIYIRDNWWRFTPDSWPDWYYYWKGRIWDAVSYWWHYKTKPWESNSRCVICGGGGWRSKYESSWECDDCKGTGQYPRHWESRTSRVFKCLHIRINNKIKKR